ncbi:hypothetical protein L9F63_012017 [Diploptera punctata]|uniref:Speedy protein A n=1 Tax=Diploptera punctata TaxID=6984 RepID=A0AAD8ADD9_DIPPU|nr:hypothetical protein L9F63_012017 [Diploptera punctata]
MSYKYKKMCISPRERTIMDMCYKEQSEFKSYATFETTWRFLSKDCRDELIVQEEDIDTFLQLLDEDAVIQEFLKNDMCSLVADRYLLAMVFTYFKRARYSAIQYTRYNFFVALYLAHDIEEDDEDIKCELYIWALGIHWQQHYEDMLASREALWMAMDHRAIVSRTCCEKVMALRPDHSAWQRHRSEIHSGAIRPYDALKISECCQHNKLMSMTEVNDSGIFENDDTESCDSDISKVAESTFSSLDAFDILLINPVLQEGQLKR